VADGAAVKARDAFDRRRLLAGHVAQRFEWVALGQLQRTRLEADEGVAREALPSLHALEKETRLSGRAEEAVGAHRREHVGQDLAIDGDQPVRPGQGARFVARGSAVSHLVSFPLSAPLSATRPERKRYQKAGLVLGLRFHVPLD